MPAMQENSEEVISALTTEDTADSEAQEQTQDTAPETPARTYDFRRPQHLSAEQMKEMRRVHVAAATRLSTELSRKFSVDLKFDLEKVEEVTYAMLIGGLPDHTYANILDIAPIESQGLLLLDAALCLAFVERMLGGDGSILPKARALTTIDEIAAEGPIHEILRILQSVWGELCPLSMTVANRRNNVRRLNLHGPAEAMLMVTFAISGGFGDAHTRICFPIANLKAAIDGASQTASEQSAAENAPQLREALMKILGEIELPLTAAVGSGEVCIRNLASLHAGDIVRIERRADEPVVLSVDGKPTFLVRMGLQGRKKAIQILERLRPN